MKIEDGYMPFMGYKTYYRIAGEQCDGKAPLLLLHGGPGSTHNYFEVLDRMALTGRQVISYPGSMSSRPCATICTSTRCTSWASRGA